MIWERESFTGLVRTLARADTDSALTKITRLQGTEPEALSWLAAQLDSLDAIVRHAALFSLTHTFRAPQFVEKYWTMLETEHDPTVLILLIEALGNHYRGSRDRTVIERLTKAAERAGPNVAGLKESLEDAGLSVMRDFDTTDILRMTSAERVRELSLLEKRER